MASGGYFFLLAFIAAVNTPSATASLENPILTSISINNKITFEG
jgi:hypothetical protein